MKPFVILFLSAFLLIGSGSTGHAFNPCNPDIRTCE